MATPKKPASTKAEATKKVEVKSAPAKKAKKK